MYIFKPDFERLTVQNTVKPSIPKEPENTQNVTNEKIEKGYKFLFRGMKLKTINVVGTDINNQPMWYCTNATSNIAPFDVKLPESIIRKCTPY